ncbi:TerD family protein [Streptomyces sp. NPDC091682]|uniref:TerD family protein n=1 Tax=unclassified Streptomyces TaxID=2593676 RepID=UPI00381CF68A
MRLLGEENDTVWPEAGLTALEEQIVRVLVVGFREIGPLRDADELSVEALAPDGTSVARYEVTDAGGETAMVLAEVYRRAGGWKFRAVGQGYANGLAGLATDHGVDVSQDAPAPPNRIPPHPPTPGQGPAQTSVPFQPPAPAAVFAAPVAPAPPVARRLAGEPQDWTFGAVFEPHTRTGRDNDVITVNGLPPGPVVIDLSIRGEDNLIVNLFELEGHDDPTALPDDDNVVNEIGKRRETVPRRRSGARRRSDTGGRHGQGPGLAAAG